MKNVTLNSASATNAEVVNSNMSYADGGIIAAPEYIGTPVIPFRTWVNAEIREAYPDLPTGVLPAIIGKRFALVDGKPKNDFKEIAGMQFLVLRSITAAESLFVRWLIQKVSSKQGEMNAMVRALAAALRSEYPEDNLEYKASVSLVYDILNSKADEKYETFSDNHNFEILGLFKIANTATDTNTQNLLRATFMICQRIDPDWSLADSLQLTQDEIDEISLFWDTENNKGIVPEKVEEPEEETSEEPAKSEEPDESEVETEAKKD
jgi:hypothetical protein